MKDVELELDGIRREGVGEWCGWVIMREENLELKIFYFLKFFNFFKFLIFYFLNLHFNFFDFL